LSDLSYLIDASVSTLWSHLSAQVVPALIPLPTWRPIGPTVFVDGGQHGLTRLLNLGLPSTTALERIPNEAFETLPDERPLSLDRRRALIIRWMEQLLLDSGVQETDVLLGSLLY
jgi:hypothetical protein